MRRICLLTVLAVVSLLAAACGGAGSPAGTPAAPERAEANKSPSAGPEGAKGKPKENLAPDFSVETFEGDTLTLSAQRGRPVVLNFWESW